MTNQQGAPDALRLAAAIEGNAKAPWKREDVADELRRLHLEVTTLQAELAAMRAGSEPVAEMVPCHTPSGKRVAVISRFQHLPIGTKLYTHPQPAAQDAERIQALELEVRQLTEQLAELRHAPTPQADSQPAPLREGEWINDAGRIKWLMWRVQDLEAKLAARAPADSVLEDAARWEFRWLNPANNLHVAPSDLGWKTVNSKGMRSEKEVLEDLQAYRYQGKPVYEVRPLFATRALEKPEIRCPVRLANGGDCPRHNLQCGWPDCNKESK